MLWPEINIDIEMMCKSCDGCATSARSPPTLSSLWIVPENAWERIHIDFKCPFLEYMWLFSGVPRILFRGGGVGQATGKIFSSWRFFSGGGAEGPAT